MTPDIYLRLLIITSLFSLGIAVKCYKKRNDLHTKRLFDLMLSISGWASFQFFCIVQPQSSIKLWLYNILYIFIILTPLTFFYFVLSYTSTKNSDTFDEFTNSIKAVPLVNILMLLSNEMHHLFFIAHSFRPFGNYVQYFSTFGLFFWINTAFGYALALSAMGLLFYDYITNRRTYKRQLLLLIIGAVAPVVLNMIFLLDIQNATYDMTPISMMISGLFFSFTVFRYHDYQITPLSRRITLDSVMDSVLIVDDEGVIIEYNEAFEKHFTLEEDYRYFTIQQLPLIAKRLIAYPEGEDSFSGNIRVADEDSQISYYQVKKIPILERNARFYLYLFVDTQTTSNLLKRLEQKRIRLENIRENKLQFLSAISHELKSPLNTLKSISELLNENHEWTPKDQELLSDLSESLLHKANLILDYAKADAGELQVAPVEIKLNTLLDRLNDFHCPYTLSNSIPDRIIVPNLLLSLIEYLVRGLQLLIREDAVPMQVTFFENALECRIQLTAETAKRLYQRFASPQQDITLGIEEKLHLELLQSLIPSCGGEVYHHSQTPDMSNITVRIPISIDAKNTQLTEKAHLNMLLVDDSPITYFVCQKLAQRFNIVLDYAENINEAQNRLKSDITYHWVLLDLHLSDLSGYDLMQQLKTKLTAETLLIAISSESILLDPKQGYLKGFDHFFKKPLKLNDFEQLIALRKEPAIKGG